MAPIPTRYRIATMQTAGRVEVLGQHVAVLTRQSLFQRGLAGAAWDSSPAVGFTDVALTATEILLAGNDSVQVRDFANVVTATWAAPGADTIATLDGALGVWVGATDGRLEYRDVLGAVLVSRLTGERIRRMISIDSTTVAVYTAKADLIIYSVTLPSQLTEVSRLHVPQGHDLRSFARNSDGEFVIVGADRQGLGAVITATAVALTSVDRTLRSSRILSAQEGEVGTGLPPDAISWRPWHDPTNVVAGSADVRVALSAALGTVWLYEEAPAPPLALTIFASVNQGVLAGDKDVPLFSSLTLTGAPAAAIEACGFINGRFYAGDVTGRVYRSIDTVEPDVYTLDYTGYTIGHGLYRFVGDGVNTILAAGNASGGSPVFRSDDNGVTWASVAIPAIAQTVNQLIWSEFWGLFIAIGEPFSDNPRLVTSPDGLTWATITVPYMGGAGGAVYGLCEAADNSIYLCGGAAGVNDGRVYRMADPNVASFTGPDIVPMFADAGALTISQDANTGTFVMSGREAFAWSADGVTWESTQYEPAGLRSYDGRWSPALNAIVWDMHIGGGSRIDGLPSGGRFLPAQYAPVQAGIIFDHGEVTPITPLTQLAAPTGLTVDAVTDTTIDISWGGEDANADVIQIQFSTDDVNFNIAGEVYAGVLTFQLTGLFPSTDYYIRIRALGLGFLPSSTTASVSSTTSPPLAPPFLPDLVLWHDAKNLALTLGEEDPVSAWPDLASATANNSSGTHGRMALTGLNGQPAVRFGDFGAYPANAAGAWYQYSSGSPLGGLSDFVMAFVVRYETLASTGEQAAVLMGRLIGGVGYAGYEFNTRARFGIAGSPYAPSGPTLPDIYQTNRRIIFRRRSGTLSVAVDGTIVSLGADAGVATWDALGNYYTTGYVRAFIGMMSEVLGYAKDVDDTELAAIDTYLQTRWGL